MKSFHRPALLAILAVIVAAAGAATIWLVGGEEPYSPNAKYMRSDCVVRIDGRSSGGPIELAVVERASLRLFNLAGELDHPIHGSGHQTPLVTKKFVFYSVYREDCERRLDMAWEMVDAYNRNPVDGIVVWVNPERVRPHYGTIYFCGPYWRDCDRGY